MQDVQSLLCPSHNRRLASTVHARPSTTRHSPESSCPLYCHHVLSSPPASPLPAFIRLRQLIPHIDYPPNPKHPHKPDFETMEAPLSPFLQLNALRRSRALRRLNLDPERAAAAAAAAALATLSPPSLVDSGGAEEEEEEDLAALLNTTLRTSMVRQELEDDAQERQRNLTAAQDKASKDAMHWERAHKMATNENRELAKKVKRLEAALAQDKLKKTAREGLGLRHAHWATKAEEELLDTRLTLASYRSEAQGKDVRLTRALEEVERLKKALKKEQGARREEAGRAQASIETLERRAKKLEKEKESLTTAFQKQGELIEVLKRQKQHLQAARLLSFTEEEYDRLVLDWQQGKAGGQKSREGRGRE